MSPARLVLVDAHAHFYPGYDLRVFLEAAIANFEQGSVEFRPAAAGAWCLVVVDPPRTDSVASLNELARRQPRGHWRFHPTEDNLSLWVEGERIRRLALIRGYQVPAREGLEVLALGAGQEPRPGRSFPDVIDEVMSLGALAAIPWGFGKWWLSRGRLVADAVQRHGRTIFLVDSHKRPRGALAPRPLRVARALGLKILAGSDPLPLPGRERAVASYGVAMPGELDPGQPWCSLRALLTEDAVQPVIYGRRQSLPAFVRDQVALRV